MAGPFETRIAAVAARTTSKLRKLSTRSTRTSITSSASSGTSSTTSSFDAGHPKANGQSLMASLAEAASRANIIPEESTHQLSRRQLELVQWTWHAVISDSANLCLNFFMDIHRMFPKRKNSSNNNGSSSSGHQVSPGKKFLDRLMSSGSSVRSDSKSSSELSYNALKFTCAVDAAVR